jgi:PadR family transcriptional regulator, regulatory protein PadR
MPRASNVSPQTRLLLAALIDAPRSWHHGYELSKDTGLKSGTLYPLLMRLSEQGLLESAWEDDVVPGRPRRHLYRLTPSGAALARRQAREGVARASFGMKEKLA